ncbi:MAG TPA: neutral/alkaline non-lysosomal ceramidase N-terminal domain-containing protein [Panacibacter sp.]|nr:neutral/alkaline non-lysosomal ceramidase N-terminal domain-containing protein [Panacibacter sp.]
MKKILLLLLIVVVAVQNLTAQNAAGFKAGAASAIITPKAGLFIAGGDRNRHFTGMHDDLFVKAVVISNGENTMAIFTVDCIGMLYPQLLQVRDAVKKELTDFPAENIIMSSTHTHSGPDVVGIWGTDMMHSGVDSLFMQSFVSTAAATIVKAYNSMQPATAQYAVSHYGEDWVENISQPAELDRSVTVLQFIDAQNKNIATLTNFACHPTVMDGSTGETSADYVAGYYDFLNKKQGGVNMFLQGAIGGWVQPEHVPKTFKDAYEKGNGLAATVLTVLQNPQLLQQNKIIFKSKLLTMPVENEGFKQLSALNVIQRKITDSVTTEIAFFNIGEACFATHPGETVPAMSFATKELMKTNGPKFVLGLSMDALGYILKPEFFDASKKIPNSEYLCSMSVGPQTKDFIMKTIEALSK